MQKSFSTRLAALEALEVASSAEREPLTDDDLNKLWTQHILSNIAIDAAGRLARRWATGSAIYTADLDVAIARYNRHVAPEPDSPRTIEALDVLMKDLFHYEES